MATYKLLILSQVILSMQLPFAVIPLIHFTSDRKRMGALRQSPVGEGAGVADGGDYYRAERAAGGNGDRGVASGGGRLDDVVWVAVVPISAGFVLLLFGLRWSR